MELRGHAALPALPSLPARQMAGPTPFSNWVIPGQVIAGAYPASMDDLDTERLLTLLLELGINTFVCLQAEVNIHIPEHAWRAGQGLRPYIKDAQRILSRAHETSSTRIKQRKIDFLHLPIIDGSVTTDTAMSRLADDCCERVLRGEKMYIHCWGGHGRTGTLVATMLARLYKLPYSSALRYTQGYHDTRMYPQGVRSPQTAVQRAQVRRLLLLPSSVPEGAAACVTPVSSSNVNHNIALSSSNTMREPVTPTRSGVVSSPGTPSKQPSRPSSNTSTPTAAAAGRSPFSRSTPGRSTPPPAAAAAGSSLFSNTALYRGSPSNKHQAAAGRPSTDNAAVIAGLLGSSFFQQQPQACTQQRLVGTSALTGSSLAAAAVRSSSTNTALLRTPGPRTPVQTRISSKTSLLRRSMEAQS